MYKRLAGDELLDFLFDENFYQNRGSEEEKTKKVVHLGRPPRKPRDMTGVLKHYVGENSYRKIIEILTRAREFFQIPESNIHPALTTVGEFHASKDRIHCNGIYIQNLLLKFLPERDPAFIVKEVIQLNRNIDLTLNCYPDRGAEIRKILGGYYNALTDQIDEMRKGGKDSLTATYHEARLKETYYASLGGKNLFLVTPLITIYENTPGKLKDSVELVRKALRPAGLLTDPLTFRQEQAFLSAIPFGIDKIQRFTAIDVEKLAEGTMPFVEQSLNQRNTGIPIGVELKEGV